MVGSHLVCHLLKCGYRNITVLSRTKESLCKLASTMMHFGLGDLYPTLRCLIMPLMSLDNLKEAFADHDLLFNCAADISFSGGQSQITANRDIAYAAAQAALESGISLAVHVSSIASLHAKEAPDLTDENDDFDTMTGKSSYSISKFIAENEFWRVSQAGLPVIVVNPSVILGGGRWNKGALPAYEAMVRRGVPSVAGGTTGYVAICDVTRALEQLSRTPEAVGQRFILSSDNLPLDEMWQLMSETLGVRRPMVAPMFMVSALYNILKITERLGLRARLQSPHVESLRHRHLYDGTKICRLCGFEYTPLRKALPEMIGW